MEFHLFAWPLSPHPRHNGACFGACKPHGLAEFGKQTFPFVASPRFDPAAKLWRRGSSFLSPLLAHRGFFVSEMVASQVSPWSACASRRLPGTRTPSCRQDGTIHPGLDAGCQELSPASRSLSASNPHLSSPCSGSSLASAPVKHGSAKSKCQVSSRCIPRLWITTS